MRPPQDKCVFKSWITVGYEKRGVGVDGEVLMVRMSLKLRAGLLQMGNSGGGPRKKWRGEKGCIQAVLVLLFFNRKSLWDK